MNNYKISTCDENSGVYLVDPVNFAKFGGSSPNILSVLKAFAYGVIYGGESLRMTPQRLAIDDGAGAVGQVVNNTAIVVDLNFSLSNIAPPADSTKFIREYGYDTTCQAVREYVDVPYPNAGNAVAFFSTDSAPQATADMDDFIRIVVAASDGGSPAEIVEGYIFIGRSIKSKTDFYTPFSTVDPALIVYFDIEASINKTINVNAQQGYTAAQVAYANAGRMASIDRALQTPIAPNRISSTPLGRLNLGQSTGRQI